MDTSKSHVCAGCGGSGYDVESCNRMSESGRCACMDNPCATCLGAGHISDVMPVKDALADAETLRNYADVAPDFVLCNLLNYASHYADAVACREWWVGGEVGAYQHVRDGASGGAFSAVPGLRVRADEARAVDRAKGGVRS